MDTRTKILTWEAAVALLRGGAPAALVTGHFDVLHAAHIRELAGLRDRLGGERLLVAITDPPSPVLAARARAEMLAGLAIIDFVVVLEERELDELAAYVPAERTARLEASHESALRELIEHVHRRQGE